MACWEPLGEQIVNLFHPRLPCPANRPAGQSWLVGDGDTRVARLAFRPAKTTAPLVIKWRGWAICQAAGTSLAAALMLADAFNLPCSIYIRTPGHPHRANLARSPLVLFLCRVIHPSSGLQRCTDKSPRVHALTTRDNTSDLLALCLVLQGTTIPSPNWGYRAGSK